MNVKRICFLGARTGNFNATAALFRDVLGLREDHAEPGWSVFGLPSGSRDYVEVYGPEWQNPSVFPNEVGDGTLVCFAVDDIVGARDELAGSVELIGDLVWAADVFGDPELEGYGWFFFRGSDGNVYAMQQDGLSATT